MDSRQGGFTFIELTMTLSILLIGVMGFTGSLLHSSRLAEETSDLDHVSIVLRNARETLHTVPFSAIVTEFGPFSSKEEFWYDSNGDVVFTDPGNAAISGRFEFFTDESNIPATFADFAAGYDLNGNGTVENGAVTDYLILPTRVTLSIVRIAGVRTLSMDVLLVDRPSF